MNFKAILRFLNPKSLILRLMAAVSFATVLIFFCFGFYIEYTVKVHFEEMDVYELEIVLKSVKNTLEYANDISTSKTPFSSILSAHPNVFIYLEDKNGEIVYLSHDDGNLISLIIKNRSLKTRKLQVLNDGENYYRILTLPTENSKDIAKIAVGMNINFHQHYIHHFRASLWFATLTACFITVFISFFVIYFGFKPVKTISKKIQEITTERLNTRLSEKHAPKELKSLILSFNKMIENIEDVFERQSNFSADIAHELRTPVSSLITQTQITLNQTRDASEYKEILYSNLEELEQMSRMVNDMLFLSACEREAISKDEIDLAEELAKTVEYFSVLAEEKNVSLVLRGDTFKISGSKDMIKRAVANLISNAIYYAQKNSAISITLLKEKKTLQISNKTQAVISKENIDRIFDRFYRIDSDRNRKSGGSGIGLAIVKSIMKVHKYKIHAAFHEGVITFTINFDTL
ncbi:MAG: heavy metal sensor histidine kinase [Campylobacteraceae bacterium]|jgi:two-component system heavy metal sensor histidine kinase CusS|nr:heavy metal sensor histidine kinase [Campylobacteraceae bacterium]